tara:strand:+ start:50 stop:310 length:261 start_codon:yes stop_codon:yes gene_type:complete
MKQSTKNKMEMLFKEAEFLWYLRERWEDEKDYEDFADYIEKTRNFVEKFGFTFIKMTETFKIHMQHLGTNVHLSISSKGMSITTSV